MTQIIVNSELSLQSAIDALSAENERLRNQVGYEFSERDLAVKQRDDAWEREVRERARAERAEAEVAELKDLDRRINANFDRMLVGVVNWIPAGSPPGGSPGLWSRDVIAVTASGDVFKIAFFHSESGGGIWQRTIAMASLGDFGRVVLWAEVPTDLDAMDKALAGEP